MTWKRNYRIIPRFTMLFVARRIGPPSAKPTEQTDRTIVRLSININAAIAINRGVVSTLNFRFPQDRLLNVAALVVQPRLLVVATQIQICHYNSFNWEG